MSSNKNDVQVMGKVWGGVKFDPGALCFQVCVLINPFPNIWDVCKFPMSRDQDPSW